MTFRCQLVRDGYWWTLRDEWVRVELDGATKAGYDVIRENFVNLFAWINSVSKELMENVPINLKNRKQIEARRIVVIPLNPEEWSIRNINS